MNHQKEERFQFEDQLRRRDLIATICLRIRTEYGYRKEAILDRQKFDYMINGLSGHEDDLFNEQLWEGCDKTPWDTVEITCLAKHVADVVLNPNISRDRVKRLVGIFAPGFGKEKTPEPEKNKERMQRRQTDEGNPEDNEKQDDKQNNPPQQPPAPLGWIFGASMSIVLLGNQILNSFPGLTPQSTDEPLFSNSLGGVQPMSVVSKLNSVLSTATGNNLANDIPKPNFGRIGLFVECCLSWFKEAIKSNLYRQDSSGKTVFSLPDTTYSVFKVCVLGLAAVTIDRWISDWKRRKQELKKRQALMKRWKEQNQVRGRKQDI